MIKLKQHNYKNMLTFKKYKRLVIGYTITPKYLLTKNTRMKKLLLLCSLTVFSTSNFAQSFKSIFNGKDLSGWKNNGTEKWYVEKKELICESGPDKQYGYLSTTKNYKNFELTLQFKQEANGNSGVFFRSTIEGTKINGWQIEVAPENMHTGGIYESYGLGWLIQPKPEEEKWLQMGKWNTMKILVNGTKLPVGSMAIKWFTLKMKKLARERVL